MSFDLYKISPLLFAECTPMVLMLLDMMEQEFGNTWQLYKSACANNTNASETLELKARLSIVLHSVIFVNAIAEPMTDALAINNSESFLNKSTSEFIEYFTNRGLNPQNINDILYTGNSPQIIDMIVGEDGVVRFLPVEFTEIVLKMPVDTARNVLTIIAQSPKGIIPAIKACIGHYPEVAIYISTHGINFTELLVNNYDFDGKNAIERFITTLNGNCPTWDRIIPTADNMPFTEIPATFQIQLKEFYINPTTKTNILYTNSSATKHMPEYITQFGEQSLSISLRSQVMLESYTVAIDDAMKDLIKLPPGEYKDLIYGGWEFGINTITGTVYHARMLKY
jgi:hypothetical protein